MTDFHIHSHILLVLQVSAVQVSPNDVVVHCHTNDTLLTLNANLVITGVTVNKEHIAVWDGNNMAVYSLMFDKDMVKQTGTYMYNDHSLEFLILFEACS